MNQNSHDCGCNDYSLLTARTGSALVSTANSNLDGTGTIEAVLTGAANGTIVKSIIIKAAQPTLTGMVRLFITNKSGTITTLFREIPISTNPLLSSTPTPKPILPMIEIDLVEGLKLEEGTTLFASTQNAEKFNVFAFGYDYAYPETLPDTCCNFKQTIEVTGVGVVSVGNNALDGTGTLVGVLRATPSGTNGTVIKSITIAAMQSTHEGMIRFFVDDTTSTRLLMEVSVPETVQSAYQPSFKQVLQENIILEPGFILKASTDISEKFSITVEGTSWSYPIS